MIVREPNGTTAEQRAAFARLVRRGFRTAGAGLSARVSAARYLAFNCAPGGELTAIAALKAPEDRYRHDVFGMAGATASSADYRLELGWVYVKPSHRRQRAATMLCERLLSRVERDSVFATTGTDNAAMRRILRWCGFVEVGNPYTYRGEQLRLFLRPLENGNGARA